MRMEQVRPSAPPPPGFPPLPPPSAVRHTHLSPRPRSCPAQPPLAEDDEENGGGRVSVKRQAFCPHSSGRLGAGSTGSGVHLPVCRAAPSRGTRALSSLPSSVLAAAPAPPQAVLTAGPERPPRRARRPPPTGPGLPSNPAALRLGSTGGRASLFLICFWAGVMVQPQAELRDTRAPPSGQAGPRRRSPLHGVRGRRRLPRPPCAPSAPRRGRSASVFSSVEWAVPKGDQPRPPL